MKIGFRLVLLAVGFFGFLVSCSGQQSNPVAVLELFTSQGCSSCPPADANVSRVLKKSQQENKNVFILSFHVDYWDYLGWKDPFSDAGYSKRQRDYAKVFGEGGVYTPQLVVNGNQEFVGSSESKTDLAIHRALSTRANTLLTLSKKSAGKNVDLSFQLKGNYDQALVHVALVEDGITTNIKRGENRGRKIQYDNIVRQFHTFKAMPEMQTRLTIPDEVNKENARIIVYVQEAENMRILGADAISVL